MSGFAGVGDRIDTDSVLMKLSDGHAQGIDRLELRKNSSLFADLLGIQVVGNRQHPMFGAGIMRVARRIELVDIHERGPLGDAHALQRLFRHAGDGDVSHAPTHPGALRRGSSDRQAGW